MWKNIIRWTHREITGAELVRLNKAIENEPYRWWRLE
jgi:hypothetical protein